MDVLYEAWLVAGPMNQPRPYSNTVSTMKLFQRKLIVKIKVSVQQSSLPAAPFNFKSSYGR